MVEFDFEKKCYGCGVCTAVCPVRAISMKPNSEGFLMPIVNEKECVSCGRCDRACIELAQRSSVESTDEREAFLYVNPDIEVLKHSASGGAFGILAETIIQHGGYVCGCVFDENMKATHIITNDKRDIERMHGSKYVQSDISGCYDTIKSLLRKKTLILFCGTPCQCAAVHSFACEQKSEKYLYTGAIICHGVPSPKVWKKWKTYLEDKTNSPMIYANHRIKGKNYNTPESIYIFKNGKTLRKATYLEDLYCFAFSTDVFLRNSCYSCKYKGNNITADVIIGDYFDFSHNEEYNKGVSSVIINTAKGKSIFRQIDESGKKIDVSAVIDKNQALIRPVALNVHRQQFFEELDKKDIKTVIKRNVPYRRFVLKGFLYKTKLFEKIRKIKR